MEFSSNLLWEVSTGGSVSEEQADLADCNTILGGYHPETITEMASSEAVAEVPLSWPTSVTVSLLACCGCVFQAVHLRLQLIQRTIHGVAMTSLLGLLLPMYLSDTTEVQVDTDQYRVLKSWQPMSHLPSWSTGLFTAGSCRLYSCEDISCSFAVNSPAPAAISRSCDIGCRGRAIPEFAAL